MRFAYIGEHLYLVEYVSVGKVFRFGEYTLICITLSICVFVISDLISFFLFRFALYCFTMI